MGGLQKSVGIGPLVGKRHTPLLLFSCKGGEPGASISVFSFLRSLRKDGVFQ